MYIYIYLNETRYNNVLMTYFAKNNLFVAHQCIMWLTNTLLRPRLRYLTKLICLIVNYAKQNIKQFEEHLRFYFQRSTIHSQNINDFIRKLIRRASTFSQMLM